MSDRAVSAPYPSLGGELAKLPAFFRRDVITMWSYKAELLTDWINLAIQIVLFSLVGRLVDPSMLPAYGGREVGYVEFVAVGIALATFMQLGLVRVMNAMRQEQMMGTLDSLFVTPTLPSTIQLGSVVYDLVYMPIRTLVFFGLLSIFAGFTLPPEKIPLVCALLVGFVPFVWGLGMISAAAVLTLRRGAGAVGTAITTLTIASGAYFPIAVLPGWMQGLAGANPIAMAFESAREVLLGSAGWNEIAPTVLLLAVGSIATISAGLFCFRLAMKRERRLGTMGLY
jgi:ABC-2 type transport system permease protein